MSNKKRKKKVAKKNNGKKKHPQPTVAGKVGYTKKAWLKAIVFLFIGLLGIWPLLRYLFFNSSSSMGIPVVPLILGMCCVIYGSVLLFKGVYFSLSQRK